MPEIQWKYYLGRGPEVEEILENARKAWDDVNAARKALREEYKANGFIPGDKHRYTVTGFLYYEKPEFDFMKYTLAEGTANGREFYRAVPNMRHLEGRSLAEKLASPEVTFDPKNELINLLKVNCVADFKASANQTSTSMVWSSAKALPGAVIVRMPADASKQHILGDVPKVPKFLKPIGKERYELLDAGDLSALNDEAGL